MATSGARRVRFCDKNMRTRTVESQHEAGLLALARSERETTCQRQRVIYWYWAALALLAVCIIVNWQLRSGMHAADARLRARVAGSQLSLSVCTRWAEACMKLVVVSCGVEISEIHDL
jgi:hypothetical protein